MPDGSALDVPTLRQDGLATAEIDIGRGQLSQALVVAPMVILLDQGRDLGLKLGRQLVILKQDAVLHGLLPSPYLALCLGMGGRAADMLDAVPRKPLGEGVKDAPKPIVRKQSRALAQRHIAEA